MAELEHGSAQPLRPATPEEPTPDPIGRGNHTLRGFVSVADETARDVLKVALIAAANPLDEERIVKQTGGAISGLYCCDADAGDFWFMGSPANNVLTVGGGGSGEHGWIRVVDIATQGPGTVTSKVYNDPGPDTIIESATASEDTIAVTVEASFPNVIVNGDSGVLVKTATDIYSGVVNTTVPSPGPTAITAQVMHPDGQLSAADDVTVTVATPPALLTLSFAAPGGGAGGAGTYPGSQTELKEGDVVTLVGTTDKNADAIIVSDLDAGTSETVLFASATSFVAVIVIANRGTSLQALAATVAARDATTGAVGATRPTDQGGGTTDGVDLVNLNNLFPSVALGVITYPGGQSALKDAESATIANVLADFDTVAYSDPTATELFIPSPTVSADPKTANRVGGTYNVGTPNFRATVNRAANDASAFDETIVAIANDFADLTVTEPATRLRSGGTSGTFAQDHSITITATQELFSAPTLAPDSGGNKGTFQGGGFVGGPTVWTRDLRVDETVPDLKGVFPWGAIAGTNRAGRVTVAITGDSNYELGGFVARTLNYLAFTADSTESVVVADETKLASGNFSNGNPGVRQPFGTADNSDVGKEGWFAPTAASGTVNIRMLHIPSVAANSGGLTLASLEETV